MNVNEYIIEHRGKIIINDRGAKDYFRIKKERIPYQAKMTKALTKDGIPFKVSKQNIETYD